MIYAIFDSSWVSPIQVVSKKSGITMIKKDKYELIPTRTVTIWKMCIDYDLFNKETWNYQFLLPFMDQMIERLVNQAFYCFLDGYSGYNQILVNSEDQEKITFTFPFGVFAYQRMSFGICNAPATYERCMHGMFFDMVEKCRGIYGRFFCIQRFDHIMPQQVGKSSIKMH